MSEYSHYDSDGKYLGRTETGTDSGIEFQAIVSFIVLGLVIVGVFLWGLEEASQLIDEGEFQWQFILSAIGIYLIVDVLVSLFVSLSEEGEIFEYDFWKYLAAVLFSWLPCVIGTIVVIVGGKMDYLNPNKFAYFCFATLLSLVLAGITPVICYLLKILAPEIIKLIGAVLKLLWKVLVKIQSFI